MGSLGLRTALAVTLAAAAWGCIPAGGGGGSDGDGGSGTDDCHPGDLRLCQCPDGSESRRLCDASGRYGPCRCDGEADGGGEGEGEADADVGAEGEGEGEGEGECVPDCTGRDCGADPVCGVSCGTCTFSDRECSAEGRCICVPDCSGRVCGRSRNCSASCGECGAGTVCDAGQCVPGQPPVFEFISASPRTVDQEGTVDLTVVASDPDGDLDRVVLEMLDGRPVATFETFNGRGFDYTLSWFRANQIEPFEFDRLGEQRRFIIRAIDEQGFDATREIEIRFVCEVLGLRTAACAGVCLEPNELCGGVCDEPGQVSHCVDDNLVYCDRLDRPIDCTDIARDGSLRGRCREDLAPPGSADCALLDGQPCRFEDADGGIMLAACLGPDGQPSDAAGCTSICQTIAPCDPARDFAAEGNDCAADRFLVYDCLRRGDFSQPIALDCRAPDIGGPDATCRDRMCQIPLEGGPCLEGVAECVGGLVCREIDPETEVGFCRAPE